MKAFLIYWVIGCVIASAPVNISFKKCPNDHIVPAQVLLVVATWPTWILAGAMVKDPVHPHQCEIAP